MTRLLTKYGCMPNQGVLNWAKTKGRDQMNRMFKTKTSFKLLCSVSALASVNPAFAQQPAEEAGSDIVVTGSRVRGVAPVGSAITVIDNNALAASGRVTIDKAIKELPQVFDLGVSENSRAQSGGAGNIVYSNTINLRGIGANATLILVDGHRVTNNGRTTDPSVLPTLGVDRIEIVADGASAIYGSDAVAGVVNLIPRRSLDGAEAFARGGISNDGVYHEYSLGAAIGKKFERGQFMLAYEHVEKSNLNGLDRPFFRSDQTASGGGNYATLNCAPGTITNAGIRYAIPVGGVTPATAGSLIAGTSNTCNDLQGQDLIPSQRYDSLNGTFTFELTDWLTFFADGFYSKRSYVRQPGYATGALTVPSTNAFFVTPPGAVLANCAASVAGVPAGTKCYSINYNYRNDFGRNTQTGGAESWHITPGIRVKLPHDWQFEALIGVGRTSDTADSFNAIGAGALAAALRSSDPATAFDPYGLNRTTPATLAGIFNQISFSPTIGSFTGYEARLNGALINLPGGAVKLAAGYEGQEWTANGGVARGNPGTAIVFTPRSRRIDSAYAELVVPIFGAENATPGFEKLELDAALRYDKYSDVGTTTNPKIGLNWTPVRGLKLRGSYGTSFRAPTLSQIYGNTNQLFVQNYTNPSGVGITTGVALSGGNLSLKPETATTWSFGADFEPTSNLRFSATYFKVDYKNQVLSLLSDMALLARATQYDGTGLILQGAAAGQRVSDLLASGITIGSAAQIPNNNPLAITVFVDGRSQNLTRSITEGIDFTANYTLRTDNAGTFNFGLNGTYLLKYATLQTATAPSIDQLNQIFQPLRFKARASISWEKGPLTLSLRGTHINSYTNIVPLVPQTVASYNPIDLGITWRIGEADKAFTFGLDVRNLFNITPPYVNIAPGSNGSGGYDATTTDPIGRLFSVSVRKKF